MDKTLVAMNDPWWQARARGRRGRSKPVRTSRGYQRALWCLLMDRKREKTEAAALEKWERFKARGVG